MIWRLTYCNNDGVQARLDIIRGASTPVEVIEGTATPFILNYKMDKPDKSGHIMSSSADISIFETPSFNIDNLKTSSETEIKVEHYINNVLDWSGFVIPDFFSKTIGTPATVEMVASDRLGTLKGVTLDDLNQYVSMRDLAVACLAKTGLSLPLYTLADFGNAGQTNAFFKALGLSSRLSDTKGRNISCYNILKSILVASESKLVQQSGAWYIVNKWQHEQGAGNLFSTLTASTAYSEQTVNFSDVHVGARRTIIPVGATTGVFHEFGGGRSYPDNFDFRDGLSGWTTAGTFVATIDNREITGYDFGPIGATIRFGSSTEKNYLLNKNVFNVANYIQSADIDVPYDTGRIEVVLDINAIGPRMSQAIAAANLRVSVGATSGSQTLWLNTSGLFQSGSVIIHNLYFSRGVGNFETANFSVKGVLEQPSGYNVFVRIYGSNEAALDLRETAVNFATISFNNTIESPKGLIYRRNQGTGFTKEHDIDTSIFGDYMRKGLDGYFYEYRIDDTSSLYSTAGTLTEPLWTAHGDTEQLPLLRHVTRQKSRMFSVAHNMISARVDVATFKPLNIFVDCNSVNPRHVVVSASYDFLRSEVEVELEQIAYATLDVREYIYSYFGDGESGISSVGGISGGGTGTGGGGMTAEQIELLNTVAGYWTLDENGNLKTTYNAYSEQELSAYGIGSGGSSGGGVDLLQAWTDYDVTKDNWAVKAGLLVPFYNDATLRLSALEGGAALSLSPVGSGNGIASITKSGTVLTVTKANFAELDVNGKILSSQLPSYVDDVLEYADLAAFPATGETGKIYITQDTNKTYRWSGTAYTEISASLALGETSSTAYRGDRGKTAYDHSQLTGNPHGTTFAQIVSRPTTITGYGITDAYTKTEVNSALTSKLDKSVFDDLFVKVNKGTEAAPIWAIEAKYNFYSLGEVSAYGLGTGGSGGGSYDRLDAWVDYDSTKAGWVLSALLGNELNTRVGNLEGGSALTVNTTGTGNAITSISKAGSVVTADKGLTFLETSIFNTHNNDNVRHITGAERTKWDGVVTDFGNLEIGGRNYWTNSEIKSLTGYNPYNSSISLLDNSIRIIGNNGVGGGIYKGFAVPMDAQREATLSLWVKNNKSDDTTIVIWPNGNYTVVVGVAPANGGWVKLSVTYYPHLYQVDKANATSLYIFASGDVDFQIKQIKIEYGSKATDWTPAPEDQVSDWSTTDVNSFSFIKNKPTLLSQFTDNIGVATHIANKANPHSVTKAQVGLGNVDNTPDSVKNVLSATKLTTARTIAGVSFDGTANIAIPFDNLSSKPTTLAGYGITDFTSHENTNPINSDNTAVNAIGYTNSVSLFGQVDGGLINIAYSTTWQSQIFQDFRTGQIALRGKNNGTWTGWRTVLDSENYNSYSPTKTGTGASGTWDIDVTGNASSATKLQTSRTIWGQSFDGSGNVIGALSGVTSLEMTGALSGTTTITASISVTTPKVIFAAAGWSMEQVGDELQMKHNNVLKMRFTSDGSIVATGEITAFG